MGQKVNPNGLRLGINKTWSSRWFSNNDYSKLLHQDLEIKEVQGYTHIRFKSIHTNGACECVCLPVCRPVVIVLSSS